MSVSLLVVVHDLDLARARRRPAEADPELVVDADAVLAGSSPFQGFEPVARRDTQIVEPRRDLELAELASRHRLHAGESPEALAMGQAVMVRGIRPDGGSGIANAGDAPARDGRAHV
jgi:hypothetical protein